MKRWRTKAGNIAMAITLCLVGCRNMAGDRTSMDSLILKEIRKVESILNRIDPGTPYPEVMRAFDDSAIVFTYPAIGGGPTENRYILHQLRPGYNLIMYFDSTDRPSHYLGWEKGGSVWSRESDDYK